MWRFIIYNQAETELWELPYSRINLKEKLNNSIDGHLTISYPALTKYALGLNTTVDNIITGGFRSWKLYKDTQLFRRGVLSHRAIAGGQSGATTITIHFTDYVGLLGSRYTPKEDIYSSTDSADIAWALINNSQTDSSGYGDLGISRGSHPTTVNRDRTFRFDNIQNEIIKMSRAALENGFDFDIDNTLNFNIYYPSKGSLRPEIVFSDFNIISWTSNLPLVAKLANRVHVLGSGFGSEMVTATEEDATAMATWGLLEHALSEKSVTLASTLSARGDRYLAINSEPREVFSISVKDHQPDLLDYDLGDTVGVEIAEIDLNEQLRIKSRNIDILPSGEARIDISFEEYNELI